MVFVQGIKSLSLFIENDIMKNRERICVPSLKKYLLLVEVSGILRK